MFSVQEQEAIRYAVDLIKSKLETSKISITSVRQMFDYLYLKVATDEKENFGVIFLNSQNQIIADEILFFGTINQSPVFPREIVKRALQHNAAAIILYHNHPSGITTPSEADKQITKLIVDAAVLLDIRVLDHIIVGSCQPFSFAEHGLL